MFSLVGPGLGTAPDVEKGGALLSSEFAKDFRNSLQIKLSLSDFP